MSVLMAALPLEEDFRPALRTSLRKARENLRDLDGVRSLDQS